MRSLKIFVAAVSSTPIELDGSLGEGGGQILAHPLMLSLVTGKAFHLYNVRAGRAKPGFSRSI